MPEGDQDHRLIPLRPAIVAAAGDQPLDLAFGQVFAGSDRGILGPARRDFPYYSGWGDDFQDWFWLVNPLSRSRDFSQYSSFTESYGPFHCLVRSRLTQCGEATIGRARAAAAEPLIRGEIARVSLDRA